MFNVSGIYAEGKQKPKRASVDITPMPLRMVLHQQHHQQGSRPVAPDIIPTRPPKIDTTILMINAASNPTIGLTPAIIENAIASGINANATAMPANKSFLTFDSHSGIKSIWWTHQTENV